MIFQKVSLVVGVSILLSASAAAAVPGANDLTFARQALMQKKVTDSTFTRLAAIIKQDPKNAEAHALLSQCYDAIGMDSMAKDAQSQANKLNPGGPSQKLAHFKQQFNSDNPGASFAAWMEARKSFPSDADVRLMEDVIFNTFGNTESARKAFLRAQQKALPRVAASLAKVRNNEHRYPEALRLADAELKIDPADTDALAARTAALIGLNRYEEAEHTIGPLFERHPFDFYAAYLYSISSAHDRRPQAALKPALYALASAGSDDQKRQARELVGDLMRKIPDSYVDATLAECSNAIDRSVSPAEYHFELGEVFSKLGEYNQARFEYRTATQLNGTNARYFHALGLIYERQSKHEEAMAAYRTAHLLDPQNVAYGDAWNRESMRVTNQKNDLASRLRDALHNRSNQ
jgi:tetratricopeptide (TPR) repeat protein